MPEFRIVDAGEVKIRAAVEGQGPLVVMVHGFPESWYSWRDQIGPVAKAGYQVAAIDVRGYGGSDKPHPIEAYDMESLTGDVAGVIDALSDDGKAILIGHAWGVPIVWNPVLTRPEKIRAEAGLSVPFTGVPQRPFTEVFKELFTDDDGNALKLVNRPWIREEIYDQENHVVIGTSASVINTDNWSAWLR